MLVSSRQGTVEEIARSCRRGRYRFVLQIVWNCGSRHGRRSRDDDFYLVYLPEDEGYPGPKACRKIIVPERCQAKARFGYVGLSADYEMSVIAFAVCGAIPALFMGP